MKTCSAENSILFNETLLCRDNRVYNEGISRRHYEISCRCCTELLCIAAIKQKPFFFVMAENQPAFPRRRDPISEICSCKDYDSGDHSAIITFKCS